jgi:hypothetical protein
MIGYSKGSVGLLISVHYNGYVEASMQDYSKDSVRPLIPVHYNGYVEDSIQGYSNGVGVVHIGPL